MLRFIISVPSCLTAIPQRSSKWIQTHFGCTLLNREHDTTTTTDTGSSHFHAALSGNLQDQVNSPRNGVQQSHPGQEQPMPQAATYRYPQSQDSSFTINYIQRNPFEVKPSDDSSKCGLQLAQYLGNMPSAITSTGQHGITSFQPGQQLGLLAIRSSTKDKTVIVVQLFEADPFCSTYNADPDESSVPDDIANMTQENFTLNNVEANCSGNDQLTDSDNIEHTMFRVRVAKGLANSLITKAVHAENLNFGARMYSLPAHFKFQDGTTIYPKVDSIYGGCGAPVLHSGENSGQAWSNDDEDDTILCAEYDVLKPQEMVVTHGCPEVEYKIGKHIGSGGFGNVFLSATSSGTVAVKFQRRLEHSSSVERELVDLERDVHIGINHNKIIKLIACFHDRFRSFFVLEYATGGSLHRKIMDNWNIGMSKYLVARYVRDIASGLSYLHGNGLVHCDLKPENVLICEGNIAKLADFGCTQRIDNNGTLSDVCGTRGFQAPEMLDRKEYGCAVDMWALGVMVYMMFFGREPFDGMEFANGGDVELSFPRRCDVSVIHLICSLLTRDPEHRITANQVLQHAWVKNTY